MIKYIFNYELNGDKYTMDIYARDKVDALEIFAKLIRKYTDRKRNPMVLGKEISINLQ